LSRGPRRGKSRNWLCRKTIKFSAAWHYGPVGNAILNLEVTKRKKEGAQSGALSFIFGGKPLPKPRANLKRSRNRGTDERRQWAAALVQKATPKIVECLIEAAESLADGRQTSPSKPASHGAEEGEEESLAALLLRLLRTPDSGEGSGPENAAAKGATTASENPSVR
jgi:hypothetical protein